jgi:hypothetical protein
MRPGHREPGSARQTVAVGFNPYRRFQARPTDYVLVIACLLIAVALLAWAFLG